jgi:hypothetical protein
MIRFLPFVLLTSTLAAQVPADIAMERAGYIAWLKKAPNSPLAAVAQQPVGEGVRLGPEGSDIPLPGIEEHRVYPSGAGFVLEGLGGKRSIGRGHPYRIGSYALYLTGAESGTVLTVFSDAPRKEPPGYYDYDRSLVFTGPLTRAGKAERVRLLGSDGMETEATEVGTFRVPLGKGIALRVFRIPVAGGDESELEIFFRDGTNGRGSYPAGRFVSLVPAGDGSFRLDFNRARNPYCAYSPVYACPLPWRGNIIYQSIPAGERYSGGGLETPPVDNPPS